MIVGEKMILALEELRLAMNETGIERTAGLRTAMGENCSYYRKSLDIFLDEEFELILPLLRAALDEMEKTNG